MTIHISVHGEGRPLILFHGWGFDSTVWWPLLPKLMSNYQLYLVDLPGADLNAEREWEEFKAELLNQLPQNFAVLGWSMGGLVATRLAVEEGRRVTHLMNVASTPRFIKETCWPGVDKKIFDEFFKSWINNPGKVHQKFMTLQLQNSDLYPSVFVSYSKAALKGGLEILLHWDFREMLRDYAKPVCYIFGGLDRIIPRKTLLVMQKTHPNFKYVLFPKAAHMPFLSDPHSFFMELKSFL